MKKPKEYKLHDGIPMIRASRWDPEIPEYKTMLKAKVGQAFYFPAVRVKFVDKSKVQLKKERPELRFVSTTVATINKKKLKEGTCWRDKDNNKKTKSGSV